MGKRIEKNPDGKMIAKRMAHLNEMMERDGIEAVDGRLSPGQLHMLVCDELGMEPLVFAAMLVGLAVDARSKITIAPEKAATLAIAITDRLYGPPDVKIRKQDGKENTFQLEFAWANDEQVLIEEEKVE